MAICCHFHFSYAYLSFGQGPRACIGMRFALLEVKIALIEILARYTAVRIPETVDKITLSPGAQLMIAKEELLVKFVEREATQLM